MELSLVATDHSLEGSSDSVSSFETFVEDSLFFLQRGWPEEAEWKGRGGL